ncbi:hypothetical protein QYE76_018595 [Lolium multiflorum]|uniref:Reverse transcriptase domain-containing protein n=1 Tax=Lolium multiflorum TaxID=4521 RepID=A0AAD8PR76_LOLMU|nr:hypothetical protein QYE76_018595 [Lolium multiflorum]
MVLVSVDWDLQHFDSVLQGLSSSVSDHAPLHLALNAAFRPKRRFKFERFWLKLEGFEEAVKEAWVCDPAIVDPFRRLDALYRNAVEHLQSWGQKKLSYMIWMPCLRRRRFGGVKDLPPDRAPGPDGFTGAFYHRAWPIIKRDVLAGLFKLSVGDGRGFARLNRALITLIPKKPDAMEFKDYRPISLVHSFAKLFSKVMANRLRRRLGEVVSSNQSAFVRGRSLHDNFILVRQVARKINQRRQTGVLLKDLTRAFDSISWSFLFEVLRRMGFGERFLKWVALLLSTANTRVLVNGVPGERFVHVRGLRQGDPTSPMLFVAAMEVLTAVIKKAAERQLFSGLAGILERQRISIYADDVVIFCKPLSIELEATKAILQVFGEASGLRVNYRKTSATLIREQEGDVDRVAETLGCEVVGFPIRYLGMQLALRP